MMRMLILLLSLATALLALPAWAIDPLPFKDRTEEQRFQSLTRELRCLVCQNENLADSHAPLAKDLRQQVFEQMQTGKTDAQIKVWLTDRYSDFVLYDPPLRGGTVLLWFGPLLVLLAGAIAVALIVRRRSRAATTAPATTTTEDDWQ